jgi:hypothetical protein
MLTYIGSGTQYTAAPYPAQSATHFTLLFPLTAYPAQHGWLTHGPSRRPYGHGSPRALVQPVQRQQTQIAMVVGGVHCSKFLTILLHSAWPVIIAAF